MKKNMLPLMLLLCTSASNALAADIFVIERDVQDIPQEIMEYEQNLIHSHIYRKSEQFLALAPTVILDATQNIISIIFDFPRIDKNGTSVALEQGKIVGTLAVFDGWRVKVIEKTFHFIPQGSEEFQGMMTFEIEQNAIHIAKDILYEQTDSIGKRTVVEAGQVDRPALLPVAIDTASAHIKITENRVFVTCNVLDWNIDN